MRVRVGGKLMKQGWVGMLKCTWRREKRVKQKKNGLNKEKEGKASENRRKYKKTRE